MAIYLRLKEKTVKMLVSQFCATLCDPVDCSPQAPLSMDSPGKNTGMGSRSLLPKIFPIQIQTWVFCISGKFFTI